MKVGVKYVPEEAKEEMDAMIMDLVRGIDGLAVRLSDPEDDMTTRVGLLSIMSMYVAGRFLQTVMANMDYTVKRQYEDKNGR